MRFEDLDPRRSVQVGDRLQRHAVELGMRRDDDSDRPVHDRLDRAPVEQRIDERHRGSNDRETPQQERVRELGCGTRLALENELGPCEGGCLLAQERLGIEAGTLVEEELQHQLRAKIAHVLHRASEPASERSTTAPRGGERRSRGAGVARGASALLDESRLAELCKCAVHERSRARVDATDLAARRNRLRDRPAVARLLAEQPERGPFGERGLGAGGTAHAVVNE
jgi:hypothetical protein